MRLRARDALLASRLPPNMTSWPLPDVVDALERNALEYKNFLDSSASDACVPCEPGAPGDNPDNIQLVEGWISGVVDAVEQLDAVVQPSLLTAASSSHFDDPHYQMDE